MIRPALSLTLVALLALAGCGGTVAPDAPALLSAEDLAARSAIASMPDRHLQTQAELQGRAAGLRARAAALRRATLPTDERSSLLRRADALRDG